MRLSSRCYAVTGLGYSTPWCVNAGFIVGDRMTLILDSSANTLAAQTIHGYASSVRPSNSLRVVNLEHHFDHIGGNSYFRSIGVEICAHGEAGRTPAEFQEEVRSFNDSIPNIARRRHQEANAFFHQTSLANPDAVIHTDTIVDLGGCNAHILLTPGHTATNLSAWLYEDRVLYAADCLIREYLANLDGGTPADWATWLRSLDRLEALQPAVVVPGHGPVSRGKEIAVMFATIRQILRESIARGHSPTAIP